jgi:nucleotide-binding universal stress UspA family protein
MKSPLSRILVYIDGSDESITAAQYAILLAASNHAELRALYVVNTRALNDLLKSRIFIESEQEEYQADLESDSERYLNHVEKLAARKGIPITLTKRSGSIYQEIKKEIEENGVDLLVLGKGSSVRSRRDELYDDTERAAKLVSCTVLFARDEDRIDDLFDE